MLTMLVSIAKKVRASVLSPDLTDSVCMPPRSSGIVSGASSRPSAADGERRQLEFLRREAVARDPAPGLRAPDQRQAADSRGTRCRLITARVCTGPCAGVMLSAAPATLISAAGIFWA